MDRSIKKPDQSSNSTGAPAEIPELDVLNLLNYWVTGKVGMVDRKSRVGGSIQPLDTQLRAEDLVGRLG